MMTEMKAWRSQLRPEIQKLPAHCRSSVYLYIMFGQPLGSFLTAVFSNKLMEAFANADDTNQMAMKQWASFLYHSCPSGMWRSEKIVEKNKGLFPVCKKCGKLAVNEKNCESHTVTPLWGLEE